MVLLLVIKTRVETSVPATPQFSSRLHSMQQIFLSRMKTIPIPVTVNL